MTTPTGAPPGWVPPAPRLLPTYEAGGIRRFSDARIAAAVDEALAELGPDDKLAVVAHQTYSSTGESITKLSVVYRLGSDFSVVAAGFKDWNRGDLGAEAKVVWKPRL